MIKLLLPLLLLAAPQDDKAEDLFKKMEEAVHKAAFIDLNVELKGDWSVKGRMRLGPDDRSRVAVEGDVEREMFCDGKQKVVHFGQGHSHAEKRPPRFASKEIRTVFARTGFHELTHLYSADRGLVYPEATADTRFVLDKFKWGIEEKIGKRTARIIEYQLEDKETKFKGTVKIWIDTKTCLPHKRELKSKEREVIETYTKVKVDDQVDRKEFELPK